MFTFKKAFLALVLVIGLLSFGGASVVSAADLPVGGTNFNEATSLEVNNSYSYRDDRLPTDTSEYFLIDDVKAGQKLDVILTNNGEHYINVTLYDQESRNSLVHKSDNNKINISWMPNSNRDYYLEIKTGYQYGGSAVSFDLAINTSDYYDANSDQDAGSQTSNAISIATGTYTGYLAASSNDLADRDDYYSFQAEEGEQVMARVTPPMNSSIRVKFYNENRQVLAQSESSNAGAIVEEGFTVEADGRYYAHIYQWGAEEEPVEYSLKLEKEEVSDGTVSGTGQEINEEDLEKGMEDLKKVFSEAQKEGQEGIFGFLKGVAFNIIKWLLIGLIGLAVIIIGVIWLLKSGGSDEEEDESKSSEETEMKEQQFPPRKNNRPGSQRPTSDNNFPDDES